MPKLGIYSIKFYWKKCQSGKQPLFSTGGGSYELMSWPGFVRWQKHFYFRNWAFCTIKGIRKIK